MENTFNDFENIVDLIMFEGQQSAFALQTFNFPGGDDEDGGNDEDETTASGDDNPPLDEDVVHSPLQPQPGGKPKTV